MELPRPGGLETFDLNPALTARLPSATQSHLSLLSQNIWEPPTVSKYRRMHDKWLYFCLKYGVSSTDPTQADVNVYISWLASVGSWARR